MYQNLDDQGPINKFILLATENKQMSSFKSFCFIDKGLQWANKEISVNTMRYPSLI